MVQDAEMLSFFRSCFAFGVSPASKSPLKAPVKADRFSGGNCNLFVLAPRGGHRVYGNSLCDARLFRTQQVLVYPVCLQEHLNTSRMHFAPLSKTQQHFDAIYCLAKKFLMLVQQRWLLHGFSVFCGIIPEPLRQMLIGKKPGSQSVFLKCCYGFPLKVSGGERSA